MKYKFWCSSLTEIYLIFRPVGKKVLFIFIIPTLNYISAHLIQMMQYTHLYEQDQLFKR